VYVDIHDFVSVRDKEFPRPRCFDARKVQVKGKVWYLPSQKGRIGFGRRRGVNGCSESPNAVGLRSVVVI